MSSAIVRLSAALGYEFHHSRLLEDALTHRSASPRHNERLEFLGDALLNLVIADYLFQCYPQASEGELSRLRASLVKGETLAALARDFNLGDQLRLGQGELKNGGSQRESILADALEAIFGAVYLDSGLEASRRLILRLYQRHLEELGHAGELKDPKTRLQEYLQARQQPLPSYHIVGVGGEPHAQIFTVECVVAERRAVAVGSNRRRAEQDAARQVLEQLLT